MGGCSVDSGVQTLEKCEQNDEPPPTSKYEIKEYAPPTQPYIDLRKELKEMKETQERAEQPSATPALAAAASSSKIPSQRKPTRYVDFPLPY